jgi:hypothetical protein
MDADLDRILSSADDVVPSSGFAAAVMDRVHDAASEAPPLPFPWRRFTAGVGACLIAAAAGRVVMDYVDLSAVNDVRQGAGPEIEYAIVVAVALVTVALRQSPWRVQRRS